MIALIPRLYPDELVYSFCARYHERMGYRSRESTGRDLFGKTGARVAVAFDFPSALRTLTKAPYWRHWKTVDQLIDCHTLLPFYAPFVSSHKLRQIRASMAADEGGAIHARLGVLTHHIRSENFRYCAMCVESDRATFRQTYWHRLHQLPGIDVCPIHKIFLSESSLATRHRRNHEAFVTAETAISTLGYKEIDPSNVDHMVYLRLAESARWLLETALPPNTNEGNRERYLSSFYSRRLSGYDGRVKLKVLIQELKLHYSEQLLDHFRCSLRNTNNWIMRLIHEMGKSQNPIEHLLLIEFMGLPAAEFFKIPTRRLPFGDGPWPCLNRTCEKFRKLTIDGYEKSQSSRTGDPIATFNCKCGFTYYRIGPDKTPKDRYYATGIVRVTRTWISSLKQHFSRRPLLDPLARRFCTNSETIRLILEDVGAIYSRRIKKTIIVFGKHDLPSAKFLKTRRARRAHWLQLLAKNRDVPRNQFCKENRGYSWLVQHDKKWLACHLPSKKYGHGPGFRTNWKEQDKVMSAQVRQEAERIKSVPGKLRQASKTLIARNLGMLPVVIKRRNLIPLTLRALSETSETIEEFAVRRIRHKADSLREEGNCVSIWKLQGLAAVSKYIAKRPLVREALKSCAESLQR